MHYIRDPAPFTLGFVLIPSHEKPRSDADSDTPAPENRPPPEPDGDALIDLTSDPFFMGQALRQARLAFTSGEVPVGAVIVHQQRIIARAANQVETLGDATAHAEMLALTQAQSVIGDWRLTDCDLYVTKEPCPMCAGAMVHCRIRRVVFGCPSPRDGACGGFINLLRQPTLNHQCSITPGILSDECAAMLKSFFASARTGAGTGKPNRNPGSPS